MPEKRELLISRAGYKRSSSSGCVASFSSGYLSTVPTPTNHQSLPKFLGSNGQILDCQSVDSDVLANKKSASARSAIACHKDAG
jgi:hypothetical protein